MRLLSIWDFKTVPYSIGDLITLLARLELEIYKQNIDKFDIAFVYDVECPARQYKHDTAGNLVKSSSSQDITKENFHYHFLPLLSTLQISKNLGSFFIFDNYEKLYKFAQDNNYICYPKLYDIKNEVHCYRDNFNYIQNWYKAHDEINYIQCRKGTIGTISNFYYGFLPRIPVVCHIRNTASMENRNSPIDEWIKFFKRQEIEHPEIIFVLIGTKQDTKNFKGLNNIVISKDYFNTVEEDMILLKESLFFMGTRSGPFMMALFTATPFVVFDYRTAPHEIAENGKFNFMTDNQKFIWKKDNEKANAETINNEFLSMLYKIDLQEWIEKIKRQAKNNKSNLELI
jgi:hypothetical protein